MLYDNLKNKNIDNITWINPVAIEETIVNIKNSSLIIPINKQKELKAQ